MIEPTTAIAEMALVSDISGVCSSRDTRPITPRPMNVDKDKHEQHRPVVDRFGFLFVRLRVGGRGRRPGVKGDDGNGPRALARRAARERCAGQEGQQSEQHGLGSFKSASSGRSGGRGPPE